MHIEEAVQRLQPTLAAYRALSEFHVGERRRLLAQVVIDETIHAGQRAAIIDKAVFAARTGIEIRDVTRLLAKLARMQILVIHDVADTYSFQADSTTWQALRRQTTPPSVQTTIPAVVAPGPDLKTALVDLGAEAVARRAEAGGKSPPNPGGKSPPSHCDIYNRLTGYPDKRSTRDNRLHGDNRGRDPKANRLGGESPPRQESEEVILSQLTALFGEAEMRKHGGIWRNNIRESAQAVLQAMEATKLKRDSGGLKNSAAFAITCYKNALARPGRSPTREIVDAVSNVDRDDAYAQCEP